MEDTTSATPNATPTKSTTSKLLDVQVPLWLPRAVVAALSGLVTATSIATIRIGWGSYEYLGTFTPEFTTAVWLGVAIGIVVAIAPMFTHRRALLILMAAVVIGAAAYLGSRSWLGAIVLGGAFVAFAFVWPIVGRGVKKALTTTGRALKPLVLRLLPVLILVCGVATFAVSAPPAVALAEADSGLPTCETDATANVDGGTIDLAAENADPQIELDADVDRVVPFEVEIMGDERRIITLELAFIERPVSWVASKPRLLVTREVAAESLTETLEITRDGAGQHQLRLAGERGSVRLLTGIGEVALTVSDVNGRKLCRSKVIIRIIGSPWRNPAGLAAMAFATVGASSLAALCVRPPANLSRRYSRARVTRPDGSTVSSATLGDEITLLADAVQDLRLDLSFINVSEDSDQVAKWEKAGVTAIRVGDTHRVLGNPIKLSVSGGVDGKGAIEAVIKINTIDADLDGTITVKIAGVKKFTIPYNTKAAPSASPTSDARDPVTETFETEHSNEATPADPTAGPIDESPSTTDAATTIDLTEPEEDEAPITVTALPGDDAPRAEISRSAPPPPPPPNWTEAR